MNNINVNSLISLWSRGGEKHVVLLFSQIKASSDDVMLAYLHKICYLGV